MGSQTNTSFKLESCLNKIKYHLLYVNINNYCEKVQIQRSKLIVMKMIMIKMLSLLVTQCSIIFIYAKWIVKDLLLLLLIYTYRIAYNLRRINLILLYLHTYRYYYVNLHIGMYVSRYIEYIILILVNDNFKQLRWWSHQYIFFVEAFFILWNLVSEKIQFVI